MLCFSLTIHLVSITLPLLPPGVRPICVCVCVNVCVCVCVCSSGLGSGKEVFVHLPKNVCSGVCSHGGKSSCVPI